MSYDPFAEDFSATRQHPWREFELLIKEVKKSDRVLDLGCGNGRLRSSLPEELVPTGNYFGLDVSANLLAIAKKSAPGDHFFLHDFRKRLPFGDDNFEVVAAIASFHHLLSRKQQQHFLAECHRVLKPGGKLFLTTWKLPRKHFWPNVLRGRFTNWHIPFGPERHQRIYRRTNEKSLARALKKSGFSVSFSTLFEDRNYVALGKKK